MTRTYAVTGCASGMGLAVANQLRAQGHSVIGVDRHDAEVVADLSETHGRRAAADAVLASCDSRLDGAVLAAGLGPRTGAERAILDVNFLGVVELLEAWRPALAATDEAKVVVFSSNATTVTPLVPRRAVTALLQRDLDRALRHLRWRGRLAPTVAYAASKIALSRWVRRESTTVDWAGHGIRLNALAPGAVMTPLLAEQLEDARQGRFVRTFPVPLGGFGDAAQLADWALFMLSDAATFLCGSVVFVDGGSDEYLRAEDWPTPVPSWRLPFYGARFLEFGRRIAGDHGLSPTSRA